MTFDLEALAEIERLRAIIDKPLEERIWIMDRDILSASSDDAEVYLARRWHAAYRKAQNSNLIRAQEIERQAAHVQELEDALVEERARGNHYGMSYEDATDGNFERWIIDGEKDLPKFYLDRVRTEARRQLQAEGKIGPDAKQHDHTAEFFRANESPAKSWQITEERKAAIRKSAELFEEDASELESEEYSGAYTARQKSLEIAAVLRAMLRETGQ